MRFLRPTGPRRFEPEVHLGLLAIIVILLLINLLSNWSLQRFRLQVEGDAQGALRSAALTLSRQLEPEQIQLHPTNSWPTETPVEIQAALFTRLLPFSKEDDRTSALARAFASACGAGGEAREAIFRQTLGHMETGELRFVYGSEFLCLVAASRPGEKGGMILYASVPVLADLNRWSQRILYASVIGLVLILIIYVLLIRRITQPIRELASQAAMAGRNLDDTLDPAAAVVRDYQQLVADLQAREKELVAANAALSEESYQMRQLQAYALNSMTRGFLVIDPDDRIIAVNLAAQLLVRRASVAIQSGDSVQILSAVLPSLSSALSQVRLQRRPVTLQTSLAAEQGARTIELTASLVCNESGDPLGVGIILSDLTDSLQAAAEQARRERLSALGEMAAGLAHQLRNSLGAIRGFATLMKRSTTERQLPQLEQLLAEEKEAEELISRFLSLSRPVELRRAELRLAGLIHELLQGFEARLQERQLQLRCSPLADFAISADSLLLKQAMGNVLDNALQHTAAGGTITLQVDHSPDHRDVVIRIADTGVGIPADQMSKLFTPFYSTRASGTGLGLAFARKIAEMHGGTLTIESTEGKGTSVTFTLPMVATTDPAPRPEFQR